MTQFSFTNNYDEKYGRPQSQTAIAVPRGRDFRVAAAAGESYLATHAVTTYAQRDDSERYIVDRVASVTSYEIPNDGSEALLALKGTIEGGNFDVEANVIGQTINFYDGDAFTGLGFGEIGEYGALVRSESLALTRKAVSEAYPADDPILTAEEPPYLAHDGSPSWPDEYPEAFRELYPTDQHTDRTRSGLAITPLGYGYADGVGHDFQRGYYVATERRRYDFHDHNGTPRGLLMEILDPLSRDPSERRTTIAYDRFQLLPTEVTDPMGLITHATYDDRVLQPSQVTDSNGNRTAFAYTPLGLLERTAVMGKEERNPRRYPRRPWHALVL